MSEIVRKIGKITKYETKSYVGRARILDLDKAAGLAPATVPPPSHREPSKIAPPPESGLVPETRGESSSESDGAVSSARGQKREGGAGRRRE